MSDNSMRWPGADGSAGLSFAGGGSGASAPEVSPSSVKENEDSTQPNRAAFDATQRTTPSSVATPPTVPAPARAADGPAKPGPGDKPAGSDGGASAGSDPQPAGDDGPATHENTRVLPAVPARDQEARDRAAREARYEASAKAFSAESTTPLQAGAPDGTSIEASVRPALSTAAVAGAAAAAPTPAPATGASAASAASTERKKAPRIRRTRKARLRLARIDPWSVMKTSFLFSIAFGVMLVVIATVLWTVLAGSGALEAVDQFLVPLLSDGDSVPFRLEDYLNTSRVVGFTALVAAIDVVILTAVATLVAFLYNMAATLIGGLEVTLAED